MKKRFLFVAFLIFIMTANIAFAVEFGVDENGQIVVTDERTGGESQLDNVSEDGTSPVVDANGNSSDIGNFYEDAEGGDLSGTGSTGDLSNPGNTIVVDGGLDDKDISAIQSAVESALQSQAEGMVSDAQGVMEAEIVGVYSTVSRSTSGLFASNCIRYKGSVNGNSATLLVPYSALSSLVVGEDGLLYNLGSSNIVGRIFYNDVFDNTDYNYVNFTLLPVLGASASNVYRYGGTSYISTYYKNSMGNNLSNTVNYAFFSVDDFEVFAPAVELMPNITMCCILFALGVIVLCLWKRSGR